MRVSSRTFVHRLATYPILLPIMPIFALAQDKRPVLDAFYSVRGLPHGWRQGKTRIAFYDGFKIAFPFNEDPSFDDVWLRNVYYPYQPKKDHVVIDVGAHMGFFTLKIARKVRRVIAVEPDPANYEFLTLNANSNGLDGKVTLGNFALGNREGSVFLDRSGYGFGRTKTTSNITNCSIEVKTMDKLVEELGLDRLDVVKIDTEGSELKILEGAKNTLHKYKPMLLLAAYHLKHEPAVLADYLRHYGYDAFHYGVSLTMSLKQEIYIYARCRTDTVQCTQNNAKGK